MTTIASFVENYIRSKPFLLSALSQGIINLTSLTRIMLPEIQEELQKEVKQGAVVMALKRLSEDLEFRTNHKIVKVLKDIGEITVRSSLNDYTFAISDTILKKQEELLSFLTNKKNIFYTSSRGVSETNIVINSSMNELINKIFDGENIIEKKNRFIIHIDTNARRKLFNAWLILFYISTISLGGYCNLGSNLYQ
jgi:hypothetical protein